MVRRARCGWRSDPRSRFSGDHSRTRALRAHLSKPSSLILRKHPRRHRWLTALIKERTRLHQAQKVSSRDDAHRTKHHRERELRVCAWRKLAGSVLPLNSAEHGTEVSIACTRIRAVVHEEMRDPHHCDSGRRGAVAGRGLAALGVPTHRALWTQAQTSELLRTFLNLDLPERELKDLGSAVLVEHVRTAPDRMCIGLTIDAHTHRAHAAVRRDRPRHAAHLPAGASESDLDGHQLRSRASAQSAAGHMGGLLHDPVIGFGSVCLQNAMSLKVLVAVMSVSAPVQPRSMPLEALNRISVD